MTLSDKTLRANEKLKQLLLKLTDSYKSQIEIEKQLRRDLKDKRGVEQDRADAEAALAVANDKISQANARIRELADAGKGLCEKAVVASHRNSAATTHEIFKAIVVLALIAINFALKGQGVFCNILWASMLVWSYVASITFKEQRVPGNIWFFLYASLSGYLLHRYNIVQICGVDDFLLQLFSAGKVLHYVAISCVMLSGILITCYPWWRKKRIDDDAADAETKAAYSAFFNPQIFPQVEIEEGAGKVDDKTSADDDGDREERYRVHEYLLILPGADAIPDDKLKDAKIIFDSRNDDPDNAIVMYSVVGIDKLEQLQKHPYSQEKTVGKGKQKSRPGRQG